MIELSLLLSSLWWGLFNVLGTLASLCQTSAGEPRLAATTRRAAPFGSETAAADIRRSNLQGVASACVERLAIVSADREAGNDPRVASEGLSSLLAVEDPPREAGTAGCLPKEVRDLIRMMSRNNLRWGSHGSTASC
ncbi:MAG: hypothetical protein JO182_28760 [Acidobacteriaceae bacterium]|nr:hypothetical protein [Acidobacteriaceae bacterium]